MPKQPSPTQAAASWFTPAQIEQARQRMQRRNPGGDSNGRLSAAALRQTGAIEAAALELWEQLINQRGLSTRSSLQLLRTIADLNDRASVDRNAVAEASCFRCTDLLKQLELSSHGHACRACPGRAGCRSAGAGDGGR